MWLPGLGHRRASDPAEGPIFSPLCSEEEQEGQCHYKIIHVHVSKQTVWNRLHRDSMRSQCPLVWNCAHRPVLCNSTGICQRTPEPAGLPLGSCSLRTRAGSQWAHVRDASLETSWQMLYCLQHYALDVVFDSGRRRNHAWLQRTEVYCRAVTIFLPAALCSSHKGAATSPAPRSMPSFGPVQLSSCNGTVPCILFTLLKLEQQTFLQQHIRMYNPPNWTDWYPWSLADFVL